MDLNEIQKILLKHCVVLDEERMITGMTTRMTTNCAKELKEAIDVIQCCKSDSEQLPKRKRECTCMGMSDKVKCDFKCYD
jgi:hypothetical protein